MHSPLPKTNAVVLEAARRALPYLLSWGLLVVLMIVGMERMPSALYRPIDGEWAKWNVEAILHFGKVLDLSPYSMLAGMGSMYFPNLPWLNPGALALGLPLGDPSKNIASYIVYAAELAVSIVALARVIGFSWPMATVAAQLYLYLLFPPFSEVFRIYDWYALAPYYAHLQATLNGATALLLVCGRLGAWWRNALLAIGVFILFVASRPAAGRGRGVDRVYRPRPRSCPCLSDDLAPSGRRALQPFSDACPPGPSSACSPSFRSFNHSTCSAATHPQTRNRRTANTSSASSPILLSASFSS